MVASPGETPMVDEPRRAVELAERRPAEEQRQIAQMILAELEDQEWEQSPDLLAALAEARAEFALGDAVDFEEYDQQRSARKTVYR
jgi:hypothetical protein